MYGDNLLPDEGLPSEQDLQIESLERRLKQQQIESEQDSKWLAEEETNLVIYCTADLFLSKPRPLLNKAGKEAGQTEQMPLVCALWKVGSSLAEASNEAV